ncbi:translocation/assembly module TamB domain-containing protein [Candidatus Margulisiibacteriota bacterium]
MNRRLAILGLFLVVIISSAFSFDKWRDAIYEQVRTETVKGLEDSFKTKVSVSRVDGLLAGQVVFHDVVIPGFAQAKRVYITFNPVTFALKKDIVPAITTITIVDGDFEVVRNRSDQISAVNLLPPEDPDPNAPPPPPFRAKLVFKDCRINYRDELGFRQDFKGFSTRLQDVNGQVSFRRKDRISLSLDGTIYEKIQPSALKISGSTNLKTGRYSFNIVAKKLDLAKWGNYTVPLTELDFTGGAADLDLKLSSPRTRGWPLAVVGKLAFSNGQISSGNYSVAKASGTLAVADDSLALQDFRLELNSLPVRISGRFSDFAKHDLDFKISVKEADLNKLVALFPETRGLDLKGQGDAEFVVQGTVSAPRASGTISVKEAKFYNQAFAGETRLFLEDDLLKIDVPDLSLYQGKLAGSCELDFSAGAPRLFVRADLKDLDLAAVSQFSPGVEGRANGEIKLAGPLDQLQGELSAHLSNALLLGQPIENLSASFLIKDGNTHIERFAATSQNASVVSSGNISRQLAFDLKAQAYGIKLAGAGLIGSMEAVVTSFTGDISWQLNDDFFASPLKNLKASGEVSLSNGQIGEQRFDLAQGGLTMGQGQISIDNVLFMKSHSILRVSGQTGIGHPTRLNLIAETIDLKDLKILNYILPDEAKDPSGLADLRVTITGEIPKEAGLTSFDPLLDLNATGEVHLNEVEIADIPITRGHLDFVWDKRTLHLKDGLFETPDSNLAFDLSYDRDQQIKGRLSGVLDFYTLRTLTDKYGKLRGKLGISLALQGPAADPDLAASFWFEDFHFNDLDFDLIEGALVFSENRLTLTKPLLFVRGTDRLGLSGVANLEALRRNQPEECYLDLSLKFIEADLASVADLFEKIRSESLRKLPPPAVGGATRIDLAAFSLPTYREFSRGRRIRFYSINKPEGSFLRSWQETTARPGEENGPLPRVSMGGELAGTLSIKGKFKKLAGGFSGKVKKGFYGDYAFDSLQAEAGLEQEKITIKNLELRKESGRLTATGEVGFDSTLDLDLTAKDMPLDILRIMFKQEFEGNFNMNAAISGALDDPDIDASISGSNISLAEVDFDKVALSFTKKNSLISIREFSLLQKSNTSRIDGSLDLSSGGGLSLEANLQDDALGLLNLFTDSVKWRSGKAFASVKLNGTLADPKINGKIFIKDSVLYVKVIDSNVIGITGEAGIEDNILTIKSLAGFWKGATSRSYPNYLGLAGNIDLSRIFEPRPLVELDLTFSPTQLYVDLPNLYTGALNIDEAKLAGPLYFDLSRGPRLSGRAEINNAVITLTRRQRGQAKVFPLELDLDLALKKNAYAVMGDIATFDLSNIFMNLEIGSDGLKVSGSLAQPSLLGDLLIKRGTVTIFNREFSLLSQERQEKFYPYQSERVKENVARFTGEKGAEGTQPEVTITAQVEVEDLEEDAEGKTVKRKVIVLSRLQGVIGADDKERGLHVTFDSFAADGSNHLAAAGYSEEEIKVMLLPDFIKSLTGVGKGEDVDTNVVVADYLSSRVQTFLFRGIERDLELRLGLESLTLEYNLGKDVRQAMGVTDRRVLEGERPDWRVGFVKGFFDKFYLDVNYSQFGTEADTAQQIFNYELTYKLSPIWSIIYYREPISLQELTSGHQKLTLKAGFSFW